MWTPADSAPAGVSEDRVSTRRLRSLVRQIEGPRDRRSSPDHLRSTASLITAELHGSGLEVEREPFEFRGATFDNIVATRPGTDPTAPAVLVGAHYDSVADSPGADDNASGVAVLLEVARIAANLATRRTLEFVGFNLEEPQDLTGSYRVGSARFAERARREGRRYCGALILEMVGYTDPRPRSQSVPFFVFKRVPRTGTFLAAVGDGQSRSLLRRFAGAARHAAPELPIVTYRTFLRGYIMPLTRLSDNASFWDRGYPALMLTDTAFLRNPHYHRRTDRADTLDYEFMANVVRAVAGALEALAEAGTTSS